MSAVLSILSSVVTAVMYTAILWQLLDLLGRHSPRAARVARALAPVGRRVAGFIGAVRCLAALRPGTVTSPGRLDDLLTVSRYFPNRTARLVSGATLAALDLTRASATRAHPTTLLALAEVISRRADDTRPSQPAPALVVAVGCCHDSEALTEILLSKAAQHASSLHYSFNDRRYLEAFAANPVVTLAHTRLLTFSPSVVSDVVLRVEELQGRNLLAEHFARPFPLDALRPLRVAVLRHETLSFGGFIARLEAALASSPHAAPARGWPVVLARMLGASGGALVCDFTLDEAVLALEHLAASSGPAAIDLLADLLTAGASGSFEDLAAAVRELLPASSAQATGDQP
jgi:hypothetical protein